MMESEETDLSQLKSRLNTFNTLAEQLDNIRSASTALLDRGLPNNSIPDFNLFSGAHLAKEPQQISSAYQNIREFSERIQLDDTIRAFNAAGEENALHEGVSQCELQDWWTSRVANRYASLSPILSIFFETIY